MPDDDGGGQPTVEPMDLVRSAVDTTRLAVLGASVSGPVPIDELAARLGIDRKEIAEAIGYLRNANLLDDRGRLETSALSGIARSLPRTDAEPVEADPGIWTKEELDVLDRFFSGNRLTSIPSAFAKRKLVLEKIAQDFEPGVKYPERDVNFMIQLVHADFAAIRRYLVDEGFLGRADGLYWRTGGRYAGTNAPDAGTDVPVATALDHVVLVPFRFDMADDLTRVANDEAVSRYLSDGFRFPYLRTHAEEFIAAAMKVDPPVDYAVYVDGALAGGVGGGAHRREQTGTYEIGWWLGVDYWGRGIASAAVKAYVDLLFTAREAMRVAASVMGNNEASKRVAEKAGLLLEGIAPRAYLKRGVRYDRFQYGLDRPTWAARD